MNRKDFYYKQKVTADELDSAFDDAENALNVLTTDLAFSGIAYGLEVEQQPSPNLTVLVNGGGGYDQLGQRLAIATDQNLDLAVDESAVSTAVATPGNERWLSIFIEFTRNLSDPRVDGDTVTVYFERAESYRLNVAAGVEAAVGLAARPAPRGDQLLLADVKLVNGQTTIVTADIDTTRREMTYVYAGTPYSLAAGTPRDAFTALFAALNEHINVDGHPAGAVQYDGGPAWLDSTTNPATTVEAQLDKIITDLVSILTTASGARKIGLEQLANTWADSTTISSGSIYAVVNAIVGALRSTTVSASGARKLGVEALPPWSDGIIVSAGTLYSVLTNIVNGLASNTTNLSGARKIGIEALPNWATGGAAGAAGQLYSALSGIVTALASTTTSSSGARKIGVEQIGNWANGTSIAAGSLQATLAGLVNALSNNSAGFQGVYKISAEAVAGLGMTLSGGTLASQLVAIANAIVTLSDAQTISGLKTFTNGATFNTVNPILGASRELVYASPVARTSIVNLLNGFAEFDSGEFDEGLARWQIAASVFEKFFIPVELPNGATITAAYMQCNTVSGVTTDGFMFRLYKSSYAGVPVKTTIGTSTEALTTTPQQIQLTGLSEVVDNTAYNYWFGVTPGYGGVAGARAMLMGVKVLWNDPGPRNN